VVDPMGMVSVSEVSLLSHLLLRELSAQWFVEEERRTLLKRMMMPQDSLCSCRPKDSLWELEELLDEVLTVEVAVAVV